jgi:hypothetical protein
MKGMNMKIASAILAGTMALTALAFVQPAHAAEGGVEIGVMDCFVEGGGGIVFKSTRSVSCTYKSADGAIEDNYVGNIEKWGVEIGKTGEAVMSWAVIAASEDLYAPGALAGTYRGASASATFGVGLGANALVGGSDQSFALQPVSLQAQTGFNIALGVSQLKLSAVGPAE